MNLTNVLHGLELYYIMKQIYDERLNSLRNINEISTLTKLMGGVPVTTI